MWQWNKDSMANEYNKNSNNSVSSKFICGVVEG